MHAEDVARAVRESGHSCFPVVHDDLDDLVGVLFVNDLFRSGRRGGATPNPGPTPTPARDLPARLGPYLIPESMHVLDALVEMRRSTGGSPSWSTSTAGWRGC